MLRVAHLIPRYLPRPINGRWPQRRGQRGVYHRPKTLAQAFAELVALFND